MVGREAETERGPAETHVAMVWWLVAGQTATAETQVVMVNAGGWWPGVQRLVKKNRIPDKTTSTEKAPFFSAFQLSVLTQGGKIYRVLLRNIFRDNSFRHH